MKIKYWMTKDPITVTPDTLAIEAQNIMKENKIRRLPVVEKGKLVGIVTFRNLIEAAPSSATSLSIYELNYLIMKMKVKDLMKKNVITVSPEDLVADAIALGMKHDIGGVLRLPDAPVIGEVQLGRRRAEGVRPAVQHLHQSGGVQLRSQSVGFRKVFNGKKSVIDLSEGNSFLGQLGSQPMMSVKVKLQAKRSPSGHAEIA